MLLADEVDAALTAPTDWGDAGAGSPPGRRGRWVRWGAAALLAVAVLGTFLGAVRHW